MPQDEHELHASDDDDGGENQENNNLLSIVGITSSSIPILQVQPPELEVTNKPVSTTITAESSRGRKRQLPGQLEEDTVTGSSNICADDGCEASIDDESEILRCDAPGCRLTVRVSIGGFTGFLLIVNPQYHLSCQGLFERPVGGWFCDDECKKNAGYRVGGGRKRRRRG
jgi:hypothetical protein